MVDTREIFVGRNLPSQTIEKHEAHTALRKVPFY